MKKLFFLQKMLITTHLFVLGMFLFVHFFVKQSEIIALLFKLIPFFQQLDLSFCSRSLWCSLPNWLL